MGKAGTTALVYAAATATAAGVALVICYRQAQRKASKQPGVKVGILGTGWGVRVQVPQFRAAGLDVTALYSRDEARAAELAAANDIAQGFGDVGRLVNSPEVELVSIVTPPYLHLQHFEEAMAAGKHVLVDKPLAMNAQEAQRMLELAKQRPLQVAIVDHELRFAPYMQATRDILRAGGIGIVSSIRVDVWLPAVSTKWTWWSSEAQGGGVLGAIGSHVVDALRFFLGAEVAHVSGHLAVTSTLALPDAGEAGKMREVTADDYCSAAMVLEPRKGNIPSPSWGDGSAWPATIQCQMTLSLGGAPPLAKRDKPSMMFIGSEGSLELDHFASTLVHYGADGKVKQRVGGGGSGFAVVGTRALGVALQKALGPEQDRSALRDAATIKDGLATMFALDAIRASSKADGAWVKADRVDLLSIVSSRPVINLEPELLSPMAENDSGGPAFD